MTLDKITKAQSLASAFIQAAKAVKEEADADGRLNGDCVYGSKRTGTLRRASMDLTRALAEMRKP